MNSSLHEINQIIGGQIVGDPQTMVNGISPLDEVQTEALIYIELPHHLEQAQNSVAAAIIVPESVATSSKAIIRVANPQLAVMQILQQWYPAIPYSVGVHPSAIIANNSILADNVHIAARVVVGENCRIGTNSVILAGVVLGDHVIIGSDCIIHPNVVIYDNSIIGNQVVLHAGCIIGSDGFGYKFYDGHHQKIPHIGRVIIEDKVEIGANSVIDRASLGATIIGYGTKIDNLVQIAHSVKLGKHNILCAMTGVAGSTKTGDHVICAANVGISDHVVIEDGVILGARTGVAPKKRLPANTVWLGNPARPKEKAITQMTISQRLPEIVDELRHLQQRVAQLEEATTS